MKKKCERKLKINLKTINYFYRLFETHFNV